MLCVILAHLLYPKIVDNQEEAYGMSVLLPKAWGRLALTVAMFLQTFLKKLLGNDTGLW
jgi:hypothetical protein